MNLQIKCETDESNNSNSGKNTLPMKKFLWATHIDKWGGASQSHLTMSTKQRDKITSIAFEN